MAIFTIPDPSTGAPRGWVLETERTAYAFALNSHGQLIHCYWGPRLRTPADYPPPTQWASWASFSGPGTLNPEEYPAYGGTRYIEPCLKITFEDGVRDFVPAFTGATLESDGQTLVIHLEDAYYELHTDLYYRIHADVDLIERWVKFSNTGAVAARLERAFSAQWHLPPGDGYRLSHVSGKWAEEYQVRRETLTHGTKVIESRRITTSHHANPWFAVDRGGADEDQGDVWFGALQWSGNWKLSAEVTDFHSTRLSLGLNDWDFAWDLPPGGAFITPSAFGGYTRSGFGAASRLLHDYIRDHVVPHPDLVHKVLYNSWEVTFFDVQEQAQADIARVAADLGVELFVVDDGWFRGRNNDTAGLGDWSPDPAKFPNGLGPLIEKVNAMGMDFGLWVEPEMVNPNSDLYRAHPDWVIHFPHRPRTEMRNQLILNMAREDVQNYLIEKLDTLLSAHNIAFIKWDMNRNVSEPGWPEAPADPREIWVRYVEGVYRVWGELRHRHPNVVFQSCSGGGGRADMGILRLADQIWTSDNTDAPSRLSIQYGFSQIFPASVMEAWVTDAGHGTSNPVPLEFRLHVSMCGALGIGGNLHKWTDAERALAKRWVAYYKEIRPIIQRGDLYRLHAPGTADAPDPFTALQYVSKDRSEAVVFAFRMYLPQFLSQFNESIFLPTVYLRGLDPDAMYAVEGFDGVRSGAALMYAGLRFALPNLGSTVRRIWKRS